MFRLPRRFKLKVQAISVFLGFILLIGTLSNWLYFSVEYNKAVKVPAFLVASRRCEIPQYTKIYVDTGTDRLLDIVEKFKRENSKEIVIKKYNQQGFKKVNSLEFQPTETEKDISGRQRLNVLIWDEICGEDIESLRNYPLFPQLPSRKFTSNDLDLHYYGEDIGVLKIGYLTARCGGHHTFELIADGGAAEFWISSDDHPSKIRLLSTSKKPKIKEVHLKKKKKYFVAVLYKLGKNEAIGKLFIKSQDSSCKFNPLKFSPYYSAKNISKLASLKFPSTSCQVPKLSTEFKPDLKRRTIYKLPFMAERDIENTLPVCKSEPSYAVNKTLTNYNGVWETKYTSIYPADDSNITEVLSSGNTQIIFGNDILEEDAAIAVADKVMQAINAKHPGKYTLESILNVEKNPDTEKGARYLVELELQDNKKKRLVRFSEFVSKPKFGNQLCFPKNFKWKRDAVVNLILTVGGQGRWAKHFISSIDEIYKATKDENINVIIVDFASKDIDMKATLAASSIPRYVLLNRNGGFYKSEAIQQAVNTILDPNGIILLMDLHLLMPLDFIDIVRKHCVKGKMTFNPVLARLRCGAHCKRPLGFWEIAGYGIFATYKSDWDTFDGQNYAKFKNHWGGEDWEMLDRVLSNNFEVERLKIKDFYHVFHTKKGMWNAFNSIKAKAKRVGRS